MTAFDPRNLGAPSRRALQALESGVWLKERNGWRLPGQPLITVTSAKSLINCGLAREDGPRLRLTANGHAAVTALRSPKTAVQA